MGKMVYLAAALLLGLLGACGGGSRPAEPEPAPKGTPIGDPVTATIGPEGGRLASADGVLTLEVPPEAVSAATEFGIQPITNTAGGLGNGYRLTPEGQTFLKPVKLTFGYTEEELEGAQPEGLGLAFQDAKGVWWAHLGTELDEASRTLSVETRHFSDWVRKTFWVFIPKEARLKVGESIGLMVIACVREEYAGPSPDEDDLLVPLIQKRELCDYSVRTGKWAVNGIPGGNSAHGTVTPLQPSSRATYTAPAQVPSPNPVTVTADMTWEEKGLTKRFTSRITVEDAHAWVGSASGFIALADGSFRISAQGVRWELVPSDDGVYQTFIPVEGTVTFGIDVVGCTATVKPSSQAITKDNTVGKLTVDYRTDPPTYVGEGYTAWMATLTVACPNGTDTIPFAAGGTWLAGQGAVSADGTTIAGTHTESGWTFTYSFTRQK